MNAAVSSWSSFRAVPAGGLWAVGFDESSQFLLIISASGRGLFDRRGQRIARDYDDSLSWYDSEMDTVPGIGPLEGRSISVVGEGGAITSRRRLARITSDGWSLDVREATGNRKEVALVDPEGTPTEKHEVEDIRVLGFSSDGSLAVVGDSHTLHLVARRPCRS